MMDLSPDVRHALATGALFCAVENRLRRAGAVRELEQLHGFSDDEIDVLAAREWRVYAEACA